MSTVAVTDDPVARDGSRRGPGSARATSTARRSAALVGALYLAATVLYAILAVRSPLPTIAPDAYRYAHLARGLADGTGFSWRGVPLHQTTALYVYLIAPAWKLFSSTVHAYAAAKVLGTVALCAQVLPVWLVARELVRPRLAVAAAALSVAGTWMVMSSALATEALAYPLATTALCLTVLSLRRPALRLDLLAVAFALLATWARIQLVVLVAAIVAAFALDALRAGRGQRVAALRRHRVVVAGSSAGVAALAVASLVHPALMGDYAGIVHFHAGVGTTLAKSGLELLELGAVTAFVPVLLGVAALASPRAWRDDRVGPLMVVFWTATVALCLQSGFYIAGSPAVPTGIQRYVAYVAPLGILMALVLADDPRILRGRAHVAAAALGLAYLLVPSGLQMAIERAAWSTSYRTGQLLGLGEPAALALVAVLMVAVCWAVARRARPDARALAVAGVLLALLAVQDQASWQQHLDLTRTFRAEALPADLQWIDHHGGSDTAVLIWSTKPPQLLYDDFFNRSVSQVYAPPATIAGAPFFGGVCAWQLDPRTGTLEFQRGCAPRTRRLYVVTPFHAVTFAGARSVVSDGHGGDLVTLAAGTRPRLLANVDLPCPSFQTPVNSPTDPRIAPPSSACEPRIAGQLWLRGGGQVQLRFAGGSGPHAVAVGGRAYDVPAGRETTVSFPVAGGAATFAVSLDWRSSAPGMPRLLSAAVVQHGRRTPIVS